MLQPRTYPELMGKALVLEPEPFITMVDDDNPWIEGLFLVMSVGVLVGLARFVGGLVTTASMPAAGAMLEALVQGWRQVGSVFLTATADPASVEAGVRQFWTTAAGFYGMSGAWSRLLVILLVPVGLLVQWVVYGLVSHGFARALGGNGSLNQTLGATSLMVAPQLLLVTALLPFTSVGGLLLAMWSLVIAYRGLEAAHELTWRQAALTALAPPLILLLGLFVAIGVAGFALLWGGSI